VDTYNAFILDILVVTGPAKPARILTKQNTALGTDNNTHRRNKFNLFYPNKISVCRCPTFGGYKSWNCKELQFGLPKIFKNLLTIDDRLGRI